MYLTLFIHCIDWRCDVCLSNIPHSSNCGTGNKPGLRLCRVNGYRVGNDGSSCSSSLCNSGKLMQQHILFSSTKSFLMENIFATKFCFFCVETFQARTFYVKNISLIAPLNNIFFLNSELSNDKPYTKIFFQKLS